MQAVADRYRELEAKQNLNYLDKRLQDQASRLKSLVADPLNIMAFSNQRTGALKQQTKKIMIRTPRCYKSSLTRADKKFQKALHRP